MELINLTTAKEMVARYATTRKTLIDDTYSINDTKSIWFSAEDFKSFADGLPAEATGVRVYLAAYSNDETEDYPEQTTVIFTATVSDGSGDVDNIGSTSTVSNGNPVNHGKACPPYCM